MTDFRFPVEAGHIMMFARALGETNPIYSDPDVAALSEFGKILAPPTFVQAGAQFNPAYPLRPRPGRPWFSPAKPAADAGNQPSESATRRRSGGLHAEQHFEYHRPVLAGDTLLVTARPGDRWTKDGRRGGSLEFSESITEYRDAEGLIVVTARGVSVKTERPMAKGD